MAISDPPTSRNSQGLRNAFGSGNDDMTINKVAQFNAAHPTPPREYHVQIHDQFGNVVSKLTLKNMSYLSTSANADLNRDLTLQDNEAAPYNTLIARFQWKRIGTVQSFTLGTDSQGRTTATPRSASTFLDNDTAVSIDSARYPEGFQEINSYLANHASILCPVAGQVPVFCAPITSPISDVLMRIRIAELLIHEEIQ
jgi:hypothetical protein